MRSTLNILFVAFISIVFAACSSSGGESLEVKGRVTNIKAVATLLESKKALRLYLQEVPFGNDLQPIQLDSVDITAEKTEFSLKGRTTGKGLYNLSIENGPAIPLINDAATLTVNIDLANPEKYYVVEGSPASAELRDFIFTYTEKSNLANRRFEELDSVKKFSTGDSALLAATNQKNKAVQDVSSYVKRFLSEVKDPTIGAFALAPAYTVLTQEEFKTELTSLIRRFPDNTNLAYMQKQFNDREKQLADMQNGQGGGQWTGKAAPELVLPDQNGKPVALSSFKGKYVLVDFWASWCLPCRNENPNVVAAFNQFKDKNFTILGVSLDQKKDNWLQAINDDKLAWTHVSDLAYWDSKAVSIFGFGGIPYNVLIDPNGTVIAEGLRGNALTAKLQEVLK